MSDKRISKRVLLSPEPVPVTPPPELECEVLEQWIGVPGTMGASRKVVLHFRVKGEAHSSFALQPIHAKELGRALLLAARGG